MSRNFVCFHWMGLLDKSSRWLGTFVMVLITICLVCAAVKGFRLYVWNQLACVQVNFVERYGRWAVVTGATDGIGLAIAKELTRRGMSIVAVSRNSKKLASTKAELESIAGVGQVVEVIQVDLSDSSPSNFEQLSQVLMREERDIGVLVNNAGIYPDKFQRINNYQLSELSTMANLNMLNPVYMTRLIMPGMLQRSRGLIINVSSIMGSVTAPHVSLYSPTKNFLNTYTRQLKAEYARHPVDIVLMTPGPVLTSHFNTMSKLERPDWFTLDTDSFVRTALNGASAAASYDQYAGTIVHGLYMYVQALLEWCGAFKLILPLHMRLTVKNLYISPAPERKQRRRAS